MMLNYYLINKYGKILSYDMGPKIGEIFLVDKFGMSELLNSSDTSQFKNAKALLCFISLKCPACKDILTYLNDRYNDNHKYISVIAMGNRSDVEKWYKENNYKFNTYYAEQEVILNDLQIRKFPYSFELEYSKVKKKGPIYKEMLDYHILLNS